LLAVSRFVVFQALIDVPASPFQQAIEFPLQPWVR
jgi:hypothetical protein